MYLARYAPVGMMVGGLTSVSSEGMHVEEPPEDSSPTTEECCGGSDRAMEGGGNVEESSSEGGGAAAAAMETFANNPQSQGSNDSDCAYPECWFEDEDSATPLRWHLFVGVLYDLMKGKGAVLNHFISSKGNHTNQHTPDTTLPWRIRVHFTSYPHDQLLPLDDGGGRQHSSERKLNDTNNAAVDDSHRRITALVGRMYRSSLKQALFLQYGSSKVAMSMTKHMHERIWEAVTLSNHMAYHEVNVNLQCGISSPPMMSHSQRVSNRAVVTADEEDRATDSLQLIPVRLMLNEKPAIQNPVRHRRGDTIENPRRRRPWEVLETLDVYQAPPYTTLGDFLSDSLPNFFCN